MLLGQRLAQPVRQANSEDFDGEAPALEAFGFAQPVEAAGATGLTDEEEEEGEDSDSAEGEAEEADRHWRDFKQAVNDILDAGPRAAPDRKIGTHSTAFGVNLRAWLEKDRCEHKVTPHTHMMVTDRALPHANDVDWVALRMHDPVNQIHKKSVDDRFKVSKDAENNPGRLLWQRLPSTDSDGDVSFSQEEFWEKPASAPSEASRFKDSLGEFFKQLSIKHEGEVREVRGQFVCHQREWGDFAALIEKQKLDRYQFARDEETRRWQMQEARAEKVRQASGRPSPPRDPFGDPIRQSRLQNRVLFEDDHGLWVREGKVISLPALALALQDEFTLHEVYNVYCRWPIYWWKRGHSEKTAENAVAGAWRKKDTGRYGWSQGSGWNRALPGPSQSGGD